MFEFLAKFIKMICRNAALAAIAFVLFCFGLVILCEVLEWIEKIFIK